MPVTQLKKVVLPAPLGPMRATISPLVDGHVQIVKGAQTAEVAGKPLDDEDRAGAAVRLRVIPGENVHACSPLRALMRYLRRSPVTRPCGRKIIMTTMMAPKMSIR